jgi:hypothetical protein
MTVCFKEYSDSKQSVICPEKLKRLLVLLTVLESIMTEVAHLNSVIQHVTAAIKNNVEQVYGLFTSTPTTSRWCCERYHNNLYSLARQRSSKRKVNIPTHQ